MKSYNMDEVLAPCWYCLTVPADLYSCLDFKRINYLMKLQRKAHKRITTLLWVQRRRDSLTKGKTVIYTWSDAVLWVLFKIKHLCWEVKVPLSLTCVVEFHLFHSVPQSAQCTPETFNLYYHCIKALNKQECLLFYRITMYTRLWCTCLQTLV